MDAAVAVPSPAVDQNYGNEQLNKDVTVTVPDTPDSELSHTSRSANTPAAGETTHAAHGTAEVGGTTGNTDDPNNEDATIDTNTTPGDRGAYVDRDGRAWFGAELAAAARPFPSENPTLRNFTNHNDKDFTRASTWTGRFPSIMIMTMITLIPTRIPSFQL